MTQIKCFASGYKDNIKDCNEFLEKIGEDMISVTPHFSTMLGRMIFTVHYNKNH